MLNKLYTTRELWRQFGPEWLAYRVGYAARMRTGSLRRRMPATDWDASPLSGLLNDPSLADPENYLRYRLEQAPSFFFQPAERVAYQSHFAMWDKHGSNPVKLADEFAEGKLRYFEHDMASAGFPPAWHTNAFTGRQAPSDLHWSQIGDFDHEDIKIIWEPSRFGFTYALVRAYWRTGDERYAEMFWQCVADWREQNPPQLGSNWKCGQEISFRVMAWCFGLYGFLDSDTSTAKRVARLAQMIAVSALRIEANLDYALSQHNNHGISEGVGLFSAGELFPELRSAEKWKEQGREVLESQGRELIYDDGDFSQHSVNYHRLMLHDYVWALRLGQVSNQPFSAALHDRIELAGHFLYQIQDETTGRVPYYGQNDGALILPLSNCDYQDFRPVVNSTQYLATQTRRYAPGPWDEDLLWLFGPGALSASIDEVKRENFQAVHGGYYTLRSREGFCFSRCGEFRHRPSQADLLHVDLWWRGQNVAMDAGTFSYHAPAPWNDPLSRTAYHNTVTVDGRDQMKRAGRFLWLPWAKGSVRAYKRSPGGRLTYWEGEHDGYGRLESPALHRRAILRIGEHWLVLDRVTSAMDHEYGLHWLLIDVPFAWDEAAAHIILQTIAGDYHAEMGGIDVSYACSQVRAAEDSPRGWRAPYYNYREPALSIDIKTRARSATLWSLFGPQTCRVLATNSTLQVLNDDWQASLDLATDDRPTLITSARLTGAPEDTLTL